jgi:hypothetical protein
VIEWEPPASADVPYVARPLLTAPVPRVVLPSLNVTVPVAAEGEIVAVNVTELLYAEGFKEDANVVVVLALFTVCVSGDDVLVLYVLFPP